MNGHPCETCLRWWECNGVDWATCPRNTGPVREASPPPGLAIDKKPTEED